MLCDSVLCDSVCCDSVFCDMDIYAPLRMAILHAFLIDRPIGFCLGRVVQIKWGKQLELSELEYNRLRWRSRRGMLELDLLLLPYFDEVFAELCSDEQSAFIKLLEQDDPDLWDWFSRKSQSDDPALAALVERILDRVQP